MNKELREIREEFVKIFRAYGIIGVAIGIVMGNAVAKVISGIVEGLVMPVIEVVLPGRNWQEATLLVGKANIKIGLIIAALVNFFAISIVVFFMVKYVFRVMAPERKEEKDA